MAQQAYFSILSVAASTLFGAAAIAAIAPDDNRSAPERSASYLAVDAAWDADALLYDRVRDELARVMGPRAETISIRIFEGNVHLSGDVPTERERRRVQDAVWTVAGVRGVQLHGLHAELPARVDRY